jgi:branched-chain amino acid transport system ATP-binding protein
MALFWIEHDTRMVGELADRIHVLDYGRTIADGEREAAEQSLPRPFRW